MALHRFWPGNPLSSWRRRRTLRAAERAAFELSYRRYKEARSLIFDEVRRVRADRLRSLENLERASPREFEEEIARLYRSNGFSAHVTPPTADLGADVIAERAGERLAIECKRFARTEKIGTPILQKLHSAISIHGASRGVLVTTARFTKPAIEFAQRVTIELVDREELGRRLFLAYGPAQKEHVDTLCNSCGKRLRFPAIPKSMRARCACGEMVGCDLSLLLL
jgi:restriction endonuclease Mrr